MNERTESRRLRPHWEDWVLGTFVGANLTATLVREFLPPTNEPAVKTLEFFHALGPALVPALVFALAVKVMRMSVTLGELKTLTSEAHSDDWDDIARRFTAGMDPKFKAILNDQIEDLLGRAHDLKEGKLLMENREQFDRVYRLAYEQSGGDFVIGTSLARSNYFWTPITGRANPVEVQIRRFIKEEHGTAHRLFLGDAGWRTDPYFIGVLARQVLEMGVTVRVLELADKPTEKDLYVVFTKAGFGWNAILGGDGKLAQFRFTRNPNDIEPLCRSFNQLWDRMACEEISPEAARQLAADVGIDLDNLSGRVAVGR
jgi:hypothetical protein